MFECHRCMCIYQIDDMSDLFFELLQKICKIRWGLAMKIQIAVQGSARAPYSLHLWENVDLCQMENHVHTMQIVQVETVTVFLYLQACHVKQ